MIKKKCLTCKKDFLIYPSRLKRTKYCSRNCIKSGKYLKCKICSKEFYVPKWELKTNRKYCGRNCQYNDSQSYLKPIKKTGKIIKCAICRKEFYVYQAYIKKRKHCSMKCYAKSQKGKKLSEKTKSKLRGYIPWNKGLLGYNSGEKNHLWKGGITPLKRKIKECLKQKEWAKAIYKRDFYTCQMTNLKLDKNNIIAHHIVDFASILNEIRYAYSDGKITFERAMKYNFLWDTENGIVLSRSYHIKYHLWKY